MHAKAQATQSRSSEKHSESTKSTKLPARRKAQAHHPLYKREGVRAFALAQCVLDDDPRDWHYPPGLGLPARDRVLSDGSVERTIYLGHGTLIVHPTRVRLKLEEAQRMAKQRRAKYPTEHQMRGIVLDVIAAAHQDSAFPTVVDRGAEPYVVAAVVAGVVRAAAEESDAGADHVLTQARDALRWGVRHGDVTLTEAVIGLELIQLADPRREDVREIMDRAYAWSEMHDELDVLDLITQGVHLIAFIAGLSGNPNEFLDEMAAPLIAAEAKFQNSKQDEFNPLGDTDM